MSRGRGVEPYVRPNAGREATSGCRERGCPWKGDPVCCPWHREEAARDYDHAWDSAYGYARYRGDRRSRAT